MSSITEKIASATLLHIVLVLLVLTLIRGTLLATRLKAFRAGAELCESAILAISLVFLLVRPFLVQSFFIPSGSMHPTLWEDDHILVNKWAYRFGAPRYGDVVVFRSPHSATVDEKDFVKRVVGLPGDTVEVREGYIVVGTGDRTTIFTRDALYSHLCANGCASNPAVLLPPLRLTTDAIWIEDKRCTPEQFAVLVGRTGETVTIQPGQVVRNNVVLTEAYVSEDPQYHMNPLVVPPGQLFVLGDNRNDSRDSHVWGTFPTDRLIGRAEAVFWPLPHLKRITP